MLVAAAPCVRYEADTKTLSCRCRLILLFGQDHRTPIGQQWYQVIEKQKKSTRVSRCQDHDQERVLVSASKIFHFLESDFVRFCQATQKM